MRAQSAVRMSLSIAIMVCFLLHTTHTISIPLLQRIENSAYDFRIKATMPNSIDKQVVIVDIDEASLAKLGHWPWPRKTLATLLDNLFDHYQVSTVGFDVVFAEADQSSGLHVLEEMAKTQLENNQDFQNKFLRIKPQLEYDRIFSESMKHRNVILGYSFVSTNENSEQVAAGKLPAAIGDMDATTANNLNLITPNGYTANLEILQSAAINGGFFDNPSLDSDGVFRRVPLIQIYAGHIYQSLALAVTRAALNHPDVTMTIANDDSYFGNYYAVESLSLGDRVIPVDGQTNVLIPYRGEQGQFSYLSAADIIDKIPAADALANKIILIGTTAAGLKDLRSTPVGRAYPGVEVHANIISGILNNKILYSPDYTLGFEFILELILGLLLSILLPYISPLATLLLTLGVLSSLSAINLYVWTSWNLVLPIASPFLLVISIFVLHMSYGFFIESKSKRQLNKLFGQYVPPELVDEMNKNPTTISMDSQSKHLTVLFSDVRNFTKISEKLSAEALSHLINAFLTPMTHIIHHHRGTIDKYMGDAIMAFWGAPLADDAHARNALLAALEMQEKMTALKAEFIARGWPALEIGIGLNSGDMHVGNMGSEFRMAYTVMGDAVNLGSRLEGLTKHYRVGIIVSDMTKHAVPEFEFRELDLVQVKGKDKPVSIHEPIGPIETIDKDVKTELRRYKKALELYRQKQWDAAEQEMFSLAAQNPHCFVYQMYVDRIIQFRIHPPDKDWNGVFIHESK